MYILRVLVFFSIGFLLSCGDSERQADDRELQIIAGRDEGARYRVKVPSHWRRCDPLAGESLQDTTKHLCEFFIEDKIRITIHNFPSLSADDRVPPMAQISRWKRQFDTFDPTYQLTTPQAFSGYVGFLYEGKGTIDEEKTTVMGWTLQIGPEHYRVLSRPHFPLQMRADVAIKVTGPSPLVAKYRDAIIKFARSFDL